MRGTGWLSGRSMRRHQRIGGALAHLVERLAHRREPGVLVGGAGDVVEADHRHVLRHAQPAPRGCARIAPSAEMSLKANSAVKRGRTAQQAARRRVAEIGQRAVAVELPDQRAIDRQAEQRWPLRGSSRHRTAVSELNGWPLMNAMRRWPSAREVRQRMRGGALMVEDDVGDAGRPRRCPRRRRPAPGAARTSGVSTAIRPSTARSSISCGYSSIRSGAVPVAGHEVEVAGLEQRILDAAQHQRRVALADLRAPSRRRQRAAVPERLGERVRPVAGRRGGGPDPILGGLRDGPRRRARGSARATPTPATDPADRRAPAATRVRLEPHLRSCVDDG